MTINDVVMFAETVDCDAGKFCFEHGIAGIVQDIVNDMIMIDAGFGYIIYASRNDVVLAPAGTIAKLDRYGNFPDMNLVPIDDDVVG